MKTILDTLVCQDAALVCRVLSATFPFAHGRGLHAMQVVVEAAKKNTGESCTCYMYI